METDLITPEDMAVLAQHDMPTIASWWDVLNCWRWPPELEPEPNEDRRQTGGRRWQLMCYIEELVGLRMCFRYTHCHRDTSEEVFNDFWRGNFEGHAPSKARYWKRLEDEVRSASEPN